MADSRTITINLKAVSDFNDVVNNAKQIQTVLNKLKMPEGLKGNFEKIFGDIEKYGNKAAESVAKGFKTKGDLSGFEKNINIINRSWEQLIKNINNIDENILRDSFNIDTAKLKEAQKIVADIQNQIRQKFDTDEINSLGSGLGNLEKDYKKVNSAARDFITAIQEGKISEAEKKFESFGKAIQKMSDGARKNDYLRFLDQMAAAMESIDDRSLEELNKQLIEAQHNEQNLDAEEFKKFVEAFKEGTNSVKACGDEVKDFGEKSSQAAEQTQQINSGLDHFKQKLTYFFGAANAVNLFKRALQSAFATVKDLDAVMTETAVVTKFDVGDMWNQLPEYTKRANELGVSIHSAYEAATIYYQQGLETNQVMEVSNQTLKMARIAGLDAAEATDRMTNALRGFNMEINEMNAERVADVYSKLAAMSASNVDEISTAMTKTASLASNANMEFETTAAFLAQMIETTRESAETAGTALKTVIARFSEVKSLYSKGELLGTDEEGEAIDVNKVSKALRSVGVDLNEYLTGMKGLDDVFIELASKWDSLDQIQQRYIATMAAGSRQQSRFIAMMQDYGRTQELVSAAENASGASQEQYQKTLESLETKLNRLKNAWDEFVMSVANSKFIKGAVDLLTGFITAINKLTSALPGALNGITKLGMAFGAFKIGKNIFNKGLGNIGEKLLGKTGKLANEVSKKTEEAGEKGGQGLGQGIKSGFTSYIGKMGNLKNAFKPIEGSVAEIQNSIKQQLTDRGVDSGAAKEISLLFDDTAEGANRATEAAAQFGVSLEGVQGEFSSADKMQKSFNDGLSSISTGMVTAGGLLMMLAGILDKIGANKTVVSVIMGIGVALTFVGSVLPMLGTAFDKLGVQIAKDGLIAQAGWGWIGIIIAAVVALITVAAILISSAETAAERVERLNESAKEAANAANEAVQSYEDLKSALDDLKDRENALDGLIVGTQAWKDAVLQVNKQVLELLQNYPKLAAFVSSNNGILGIDYDAAAEVLDEYNQIAIEAQKASVYSNAIATQAKTDLTKENLFSNGTLFAQNRLGDVDQSVDLLAKALAGDAKAIEALDFNPQKFKEGSDAFNDYIFELASSKGILINATNEGIGALRSYGQELLTTESEMSALLPALIDSKVANEEYADSVKNFLSSDFLSGELEANANRKYETLSKEEKDAYEEYFKDLYGSDFKKVKANGDVELADDKTIKREDAMNQFTGAKAGDIVDPIVDEFVNKIASSDDEVAKILKNFYDKGGGGNLTKADIEGLGGLEGFEEAIKNLGLSDELTQQITADLLEGIEFSNTAIQNLQDNVKELGFTTSTVIGGFEQLTGSAMADLIDNIKEVEQESGVAAGIEIRDRYNAIAKELSDEEITKFGDALAMIDWNDIKSVEELPSFLEDLGINTEEIEGPLGDLIDSIIELGNASSNTSGELAANAIKGSNKVVSELRSGKADRSFTEEEYKALMNLAPELASQFTTDAEGNYLYLGNSMADLQAAVESNTLALIEDTRAELEGKIAGADAWERLSENSSIHMSDAMKGDEDAQAWMLDRFIKQNQGNLDSFGIEGLGNGTTAQDLVKNGTVDEIFQALMTLLEQRAANEAQLETINKTIPSANLGSDQTAALTGNDNEAVRSSIMQDASTYGLDAEAILADSAKIEESLEHLGDSSQEVADRIAFDNARMSASFEELSSNWNNWKEALNSKDASTYGAAIESLRNNMKGLLGVNAKLSDSFVTDAKTLGLLEEAVNGNLDAISELRAEAAKDIVLHTEVDENSQQQVVSAIDDLIANTDFNDIEVGATLDSLPFGQALVDLINTTYGATAQAQEILNSLGFEPDISYVDVPMNSTSYDAETSTYTYTDPITGETKTAKVDSQLTAGEDGMLHIPVINGSKTTFQGSPGASISPASRPARSGGGGGGGGGGKEEKPTYWENPYDELYNLNEKINEALRERERLERRYQKIAKLNTTTAQDMRQAFTDQIAQLQKEIELQRQLEQGRLRQLRNVGSQIYTDKEGNRSTFSQLGVTKYASYDEKTGLIQIDWDAIEAVSRDPNRSEEGEAIEAYISKLEELVEGYEEIRDTIWDMEDEIEDLAQQAIESYLDFEDRVYDALVEEREREIEAYKALSDAIQDSVSRVIDKMQQQIEEERQARENDKTEQEIADKEARLAYLSRDTSGANQLEVMKLQQEIDDARQNYTDSLIDQAIQEMQKDADKAAEQREQQISLLEAQLKWDEENGVLRKLAQDLILDGDAKNALGNQKLVELLKETEGYKGMSYFGQENWENGFVEAWNKAQAAYEAAEAAKKQKEKSAANVGGNTSSNNNSGGGSSATTNNSTTPKTTWDSIYAAYTKINQGAWGNGVEHRVEMGKKEGFSEESVRKGQQLINYTYPPALGGSGYSMEYAKRLLGYKKGGLADFTGPAWLDGTRSHPEMVLSAADTENFIMLKDILGSILKRSSEAFGVSASEFNFDIDINADLSDDYDVEQLADKVKGIIYDEAMYKNVNTVNRLR